jgi:hypothetical protein
MRAVMTCDECRSVLVDIAEEGVCEVYCPNCDVGERVLGEADECICGMRLANYFPFSSCPACITGEPTPMPRKLNQLH